MSGPSETSGSVSLSVRDLTSSVANNILSILSLKRMPAFAAALGYKQQGTTVRVQPTSASIAISGSGICNGNHGVCINNCCLMGCKSMYSGMHILRFQRWMCCPYVQGTLKVYMTLVKGRGDL
jgi:hypothetical protein